MTYLGFLVVCCYSDFLHQSLSQLQSSRSADDLNRQIGQLQQKLSVSEDKYRAVSEELEAYRSLNMQLQNRLLINPMQPSEAPGEAVQSSKSQSVLQQAIDYFVPKTDLQQRPHRKRDPEGCIKHISLSFQDRRSA
jgi:hypothetical protein